MARRTNGLIRDRGTRNARNHPVTTRYDAAPENHERPEKPRKTRRKRTRWRTRGKPIRNGRRRTRSYGLSLRFAQPFRTSRLN